MRRRRICEERAGIHPLPHPFSLYEIIVTTEREMHDESFQRKLCTICPVFLLFQGKHIADVGERS
jgi:hypothetical protein